MESRNNKVFGLVVVFLCVLIIVLACLYFYYKKENKKLSYSLSSLDSVERNLVAIPLTLDDWSRLKKLFSKICRKTLTN